MVGVAHLHAPDHRLTCFMAALQHIDDGLGSLSQADGLKCGWCLPLGFGLCHSVSLLQLFRCDSILQCLDGIWHLIGFDDALGLNSFTYQLQKLSALRLQQYQVASGFGFEFVQHLAIVRLSQGQALQQRFIEGVRRFKLYPVTCVFNDMKLLQITPTQQVGQQMQGTLVQGILLTPYA